MEMEDIISNKDTEVQVIRNKAKNLDEKLKKLNEENAQLTLSYTNL